jgi:hypothetical protein
MGSRKCADLSWLPSGALPQPPSARLPLPNFVCLRMEARTRCGSCSTRDRCPPGSQSYRGSCKERAGCKENESWMLCQWVLRIGYQEHRSAHALRRFEPAMRQVPNQALAGRHPTSTMIAISMNVGRRAMISRQTAWIAETSVRNGEACIT